ncbi:MAG: hypothetical protein AB7O97_10910 [Planctomycetota bacterium]
MLTRTARSTLAVLTLLTAAATAQEYRYEQNDELGVRFRVHRKLTPTPVKIGSADPHTKMIFESADPGDKIRGEWSWYLRVLDFPKASASPKVKPKTEGATGTAEEAEETHAESPLKCRDFREWVTEKDPYLRNRTYKDKAEPTKGRRKTPDYEYWEYSDSHQQLDDTFWYSCTAVYDLPDRQIVLQGVIPAIGKDKPKDKLIKFVKAMIGSMEPLDPKDIVTSDEPDEDRDSFATTPERLAELEKAKKNIANLANWDYFTSPNYIVLYSWDADKPQKQRDATKFAREIVDGLEAMRERYAEEFPPHENMLQLYSILRICDNYEDFANYSGVSGGVVGWFSPASKELVVFDDKDRYFGNKEETIYSTAMHEGWHQYGHTYFGEKSELHRWFDEGIGDYFGSWQPKGRKWNYEIDKGRYQSIRQQIARGTYINPRELVAWERSKFYGPRAADHYAQAYSMIDFLKRGPDRLGKRFDESWNSILDKYRLGMLETKDQKKAVEKAFEGVDWDAFTAAWLDWVTKYMK